MKMITRRDWLKGLSFLAADGLLGCNTIRFVAGGTVEIDPNLSVFISDTHVKADGFQLEYFHRCVNDIPELSPRPANVICFGDIAHLHGKIEDYRASEPDFRRLMAAGIKVTFGMGNHDVRAAFADVWYESVADSLVSGRVVHEVNLGYCDLIVLDTLHEMDETATPNNRLNGWIGSGQLKGAQFEWLKAEAVRRKRPFLLGAHHIIHEITDGDSNAINDVAVMTPNCLGWVHGHDHTWKNRVVMQSGKEWWRDITPRKRVLGLPSTGHFGDIGYAICRTYPDRVTVDLVETDHFFPAPENRTAIDLDIIAEHQHQRVTFRYPTTSL